MAPPEGALVAMGGRRRADRVRYEPEQGVLGGSVDVAKGMKDE